MDSVKNYMKCAKTNLKNNNAAAKITVEPVDIWINTHTVHPVPIHFFLTRFISSIKF